MLLKLLMIALGGALGTLARYGTGTLLSHWIERHGFPFATVMVNLLGCFLIGVAQGAFLERWNAPEAVRLSVIAGFLGGYTTFSAYGWETAVMLREGHLARAGMNLVASNVVGIVLVLAGYAIGRR